MAGPPGSGKTTAIKQHPFLSKLTRISQDEMGKEGHFEAFTEAIKKGENVVVDRMNFNKKQRRRYIESAKKAGYRVDIAIQHTPKEACYSRCIKREGHETIKTKEDAQSAIDFFFKNYERPEPDEADSISNLGWSDGHTMCIVCDLDGTLANVDHRRKYVRVEKPDKPNWKKFFDKMVDDPVNTWCSELITMMSDRYPIVYATGRPADYEFETKGWLEKNGLMLGGAKLFMREAGDYRSDRIVKQNILDFEIKTRYDILFVVDDRKQVVDMWRDNSYTVLQCAEGNF